MNPSGLWAVMPVFNEEESIAGAISEWAPTLASVSSDATLLVVDDGSTDRTPEILTSIVSEHGGKVRVLRCTNRGHGQACLAGYREALRQEAEWIFQIDSDGQCDPRYFPSLWSMRDRADILYGVRTSRDDGGVRRLATNILRLNLGLLHNAWCEDPNVPYRLMNHAPLARHLPRIPDSFYLANVALAVLLKKDRSLRHEAISIGFRERTAGRGSAGLILFAKRAFELNRQLKSLN